MQDYVFSILTGYVDTPAGVDVDEGKAYNPYFAGGIIGMPQQLFDEGIEYDDGQSSNKYFMHELQIMSTPRRRGRSVEPFRNTESVRSNLTKLY